MKDSKVSRQGLQVKICSAVIWCVVKYGSEKLLAHMSSVPSSSGVLPPYS